MNKKQNKPKKHKNRAKDINIKASANQWKKFKEVCKEHECEPQITDKEKITEVVKSVVKS